MTTPLLQNLHSLISPAKFALEYGITLDDAIFTRPNPSAAYALLHYLISTIDSPLAKSLFKPCFPILHREHEHDFLKVVHNRLSVLSRHKLLPPPIPSHTLILSAGGPAFEKLLTDLSYLAVRHAPPSTRVRLRAASFQTREPPKITRRLSRTEPLRAQRLPRRFLARGLLEAPLGVDTQSDIVDAAHWPTEADSLREKIDAFEAHLSRLRGQLKDMGFDRNGVDMRSKRGDVSTADTSDDMKMSPIESTESCSSIDERLDRDRGHDLSGLLTFSSSDPHKPVSEAPLKEQLDNEQRLLLDSTAITNGTAVVIPVTAENVQPSSSPPPPSSPSCQQQQTETDLPHLLEPRLTEHVPDLVSGVSISVCPSPPPQATEVQPPKSEHDHVAVNDVVENSKVQPQAPSTAKCDQSVPLAADQVAHPVEQPLETHQTVPCFVQPPSVSPDVTAKELAPVEQAPQVCDALKSPEESTVAPVPETAMEQPTKPVTPKPDVDQSPPPLATPEPVVDQPSEPVREPAEDAPPAQPKPLEDAITPSEQPSPPSESPKSDPSISLDFNDNVFDETGSVLSDRLGPHRSVRFAALPPSYSATRLFDPTEQPEKAVSQAESHPQTQPQPEPQHPQTPSPEKALSVEYEKEVVAPATATGDTLRSEARKMSLRTQRQRARSLREPKVEPRSTSAQERRSHRLEAGRRRSSIRTPKASGDKPPRQPVTSDADSVLRAEMLKPTTTIPHHRKQDSVSSMNSFLSADNPRPSPQPKHASVSSTLGTSPVSSSDDSPTNSADKPVGTKTFFAGQSAQWLATGKSSDDVRSVVSCDTPRQPPASQSKPQRRRFIRRLFRFGSRK